jgi:hypothetical protein
MSPKTILQILENRSEQVPLLRMTLPQDPLPWDRPYRQILRVMKDLLKGLPGITPTLKCLANTLSSQTFLTIPYPNLWGNPLLTTALPREVCTLTQKSAAAPLVSLTARLTETSLQTTVMRQRDPLVEKVIRFIWFAGVL